jgi:hypothetical protein
MLRIPHSLESLLTDAGKVVSLKHWPRFTPRVMVQLEGLAKLKKCNDLIWAGTHGLDVQQVHVAQLLFSSAK